MLYVVSLCGFQYMQYSQNYEASKTKEWDFEKRGWVFLIEPRSAKMRHILGIHDWTVTTN